MSQTPDRLEQSRVIRSWIVAVSVAGLALSCGGTVPVPAGVQSRPRVAKFDPSGTWSIEYRSGKVTATAIASLSPYSSGPFFGVHRNDRAAEPSNDFALTENDFLYVAYTDAADAGASLNLIGGGKDPHRELNVKGSPHADLSFELWDHSGAFQSYFSDGKASVSGNVMSQSVGSSLTEYQWFRGEYADCGIGLTAGTRSAVARGFCSTSRSSSSTSYTGLGSSEERTIMTTRTDTQYVSSFLGIAGLEWNGSALRGKGGGMTFYKNGKFEAGAYDEVWTRIDAPRPGLAWVTPLDNKPVAGAVVGGRETVVCRMPYKNGLHPGKLYQGWCYIGWGGKEFRAKNGYEVLTGKGHWASGGAPGGFVGGYAFDSEGRRELLLCRVKYQGPGHPEDVEPGKVVGDTCNFGWGGNEIAIKEFEVFYPDGAPPG